MHMFTSYYQRAYIMHKIMGVHKMCACVDVYKVIAYPKTVNLLDSGNIFMGVGK